MDYTTWSDADLENEDNRLAVERLELLTQHKAVQAERNVRVEKSRAEATAAAMTDTERAALLQVLSAPAIESDAAVGIPGA